MATTHTDIPKITAANTKKEMLEAYKAVLEMLETRSGQQLQPQKVKEEREKKDVVGSAETLTPEKVVHEINQLKLELGKALAHIASKLEEETARYVKVKKAIEVKEKELQEIFEIEKAAHTLAALLEAHKQQRLDFEQEIAERKRILQKEIDETKARWEKEKKDHNEQWKEQKEQETTIRRREKEEYEYKLQREREQKLNALHDQLAGLEKEIEEKRNAFEQQVKTKEDELNEREQVLSEREKELNVLQEKVEAFPKELEKQVKKAVEETTARLSADAAKNQELLSKGFEGEKNVLLAKISAMEQLVASQQKQIEKLTDQVDTAYVKVQDIAVKAVATTGHLSFPAPASRSVVEEREM